MAKTRQKRRKARSEAEIRRLLADFESSNLTQRAFSERHQVPLSTLQFWRRRFKNTAKGNPVPKVPEPSLSSPNPIVIPVGVVTTEPGLAYELELPNGFLLRIPTCFHPEELRHLLQVISPC